MNIYLTDQLGERVKKAVLEVSRICQTALEREVDTAEAAKAAKKGAKFERIELEVGDPAKNRPFVTKAFQGRWLVTDMTSEDDSLIAPYQWSVALTKRGQIAVYAEYEEYKSLEIYPSLDKAQRSRDGGIPDDILAAAAKALGVNRVIEMDI